MSEIRRTRWRQSQLIHSLTKLAVSTEASDVTNTEPDTEGVDVV